MVTTKEQAQHTPDFSAKVPDGYLECRDCGQVLDLEAWVSVPCRGLAPEGTSGGRT